MFWVNLQDDEGMTFPLDEPTWLETVLLLVLVVVVIIKSRGSSSKLHNFFPELLFLVAKGSARFISQISHWSTQTGVLA